MRKSRRCRRSLPALVVGTCLLLAMLTPVGHAQAGQDQAGQDQAGQDQAGQDQAGQDQAGQDQNQEKQNPAGDSSDSSTTDPPATQTNSNRNAQPPAFVLREDVRKAVFPLFKRIATAKSTRVTAEMLTDSVMNGQTIDQKKSAFQVAAQAPDGFTIYLKEAEQRTRIYCDGEEFVAALSPEAYMPLGPPISPQDAVESLPLPMGPYPEPMLALSLAGVDPAVSLLGGMKDLKVVDRKPFQNRGPAIHIKGVQLDGVVWDIWFSEGDKPEPFRILIDLTPMLRASGKMSVPAGFSQQVRYDFTSFNVDKPVSHSLFKYPKKPDSVRYDSIAEFAADQQKQLAAATEKQQQKPVVHPMESKAAPAFRAADLNGKIVDTRRLRNRLIVLNFWESAIPASAESIPVFSKVCDSLRSAGVILLNVNTGESKETVRKYYRKSGLRYPTLLDPDGKVADGYKVDRIPQTFLISRDRKIIKVLTGFGEKQDSAKRFREAIDTALKN